MAVCAGSIELRADYIGCLLAGCLSGLRVGYDVVARLPTQFSDIERVLALLATVTDQIVARSGHEADVLGVAEGTRTWRAHRRAPQPSCDATPLRGDLQRRRA